MRPVAMIMVSCVLDELDALQSLLLEPRYRPQEKYCTVRLCKIGIFNLIKKGCATSLHAFIDGSRGRILLGQV